MAELTQSSFIPKQCIPKSAALFQEIIGNTSEQVCQKLFTILPPFPPNGKIHDNGCGTGEVTGEIMKIPNLDPSIHIFATDRNAYMVEGCQKKVDAHKWPVTTKVVKAQDLDFDDNFFDSSFTNFVVASLTDPEKAAEHLYRTLKPGGKATVCTWAFMPHDLPLKKADLMTRGDDAQLQTRFGGKWLTRETLKEFMVSGGFEEGKVEMTTIDVYHPVKDLKRWAECLWSFIATRDDGGWKQIDEDRWEEAINILVREMAWSDACEEVEGGGWRLKFVANVATGTK